MSEYFAVEFDAGFYAKKQPNYEWSLTRPIENAHLYKTEKAAHERGEWGLNLKKYGNKYRLVMVEVITENRGEAEWISTEDIQRKHIRKIAADAKDREVISLNVIRPCEHDWKDNSAFHEGHYTYVCTKCGQKNYQY